MRLRHEEGRAWPPGPLSCPALPWSLVAGDGTRGHAYVTLVGRHGDCQYTLDYLGQRLMREHFNRIRLGIIPPSPFYAEICVPGPKPASTGILNAGSWNIKLKAGKVQQLEEHFARIRRGQDPYRPFAVAIRCIGLAAIDADDAPARTSLPASGSASSSSSSASSASSSDSDAYPSDPPPPYSP